MSRSALSASGLRLDRTITFGLMVTIIFQTAGGLMWVGAAEARLSALETQVALTLAVSERLARLEGQTEHIAHSLDRIEKRLMTDD